MGQHHSSTPSSPVDSLGKGPEREPSLATELAAPKPPWSTSATRPELAQVRVPTASRVPVVPRPHPSPPRPDNAPVPATTDPSAPPWESLPEFGEEISRIPASEGNLDTDHPRYTEVGDPDQAPLTRDRALLLRMDGAEAGRVHGVDGPSTTIGRDQTSTIWVSDRGVSRTHATIEKSEDGYRLRDLQSANGTHVQGRRVQECGIEDGDLVQLGPRVSFRFTITDAQQEALLRDLYRASTRDALTGVCNRKHLDERLAAEIAYSQRHKSELSVVLFDIDFFKKVNDTYGHSAGDRVLQFVAGTVNQRLRAEDLLGRYGGEEFVVVLRGTGLTSAVRVAERMRSVVASGAVFVEGHHIPVTISAGCADLKEPGITGVEQLIELADQRLYAAKRGGRNRVVGA